MPYMFYSHSLGSIFVLTLLFHFSPLLCATGDSGNRQLFLINDIFIARLERVFVRRCKTRVRNLPTNFYAALYNFTNSEKERHTCYYVTVIGGGVRGKKGGVCSKLHKLPK